jgi:hypothetical protein
MTTDYGKLKAYLNESNSTSFENKISNAKNTVFDFLSKNIIRNDQNSVTSTHDLSFKNNGDEQSDSWFKEADSDPYCPKLVCLILNV